MKPIDRRTLLRLINVQAPKLFATTAAKADLPKSKDESRSGRALALAGKVRRRGGSRADFDDALSADSELAVWASDERQVHRAWARAGDGLGDLDGFAFNEDGVALAFTARFKNQLRFDHDAGHWFRWTGTHWKTERTRLASAWARDTCRDMANAGLLDPDTKPLAKAATAAAVERFAQADRSFAVTSDIWDTNPWLLGTPGGTVDLQTGALRQAVPDEFITKATAAAPERCFDPGLDCPLWLGFLLEASGRDQGLVRFLQQWCGYCLTGNTREHALLFIYGPGGNGKSVFLNTVMGVIGDYGPNAGMERSSALQMAIVTRKSLHVCAVHESCVRHVANDRQFELRMKLEIVLSHKATSQSCGTWMMPHAADSTWCHLRSNHRIRIPSLSPS